MSAMNPNYEKLPEHMQNAMRLYIEHGVFVGDFLRLIICNDFVHAAGYGDWENQRSLFNYCSFLVNDMPMQAWGSVEKYNAWVAQGGKNGLTGVNDSLGIEHG